MPYEFRPAVREQTSLLIGLAGASGSGKTFSALSLAEGLAGGGKIAFIDTEAGRALHYADRFKFDHCELRPPFRPQSYADAIGAADKAGYRVIIVDSTSHEYDGDGGIVEWAAELEAGGTKSPGNWKEPKTHHKRMMSRLLQCRAHLVFCLRAEEKIKIERNPQNGKTVVVPIGWQPLCEKRFMFELTASFLLLPERPGIPVPIKLQDQHRAAFPPDRQIGRESGEALAAWASGGAARPSARTADTTHAAPVDGEPRRLDVPLLADQTGPDWRAWSAALAATLRACTADDATAWWEANADALKTLAAAAPKMHARLVEVMKATTERAAA